MSFEYIQPNEFKYNSYVASYHPDWPRLDVSLMIQPDPLDLKRQLNLATALQMLFYVGLSFVKISRTAQISGSSLYNYRDRNNMDELFSDVKEIGRVEDIYFRERGLKVFLCRSPKKDISKIYRDVAKEEKSRFLHQ